MSVDGVRTFPLDVELYQKADQFPLGKDDPEFQKKPEIALNLIEQCLKRNYRPQVILMDGGYGNNGNLLKEIEEKRLKYIGVIAKNRKVKFINSNNIEEEKIIEDVAKELPNSSFQEIKRGKNAEKSLWVAKLKVKISTLNGTKVIAIVMNANSFETATDIDYLMTNEEEEKATIDWIIDTYCQRNWIEVFFREIKGWLGLSEYQVRKKRSLMRHFILVFRCSHIYSMASFDRRIEKAMGK